MKEALASADGRLSWTSARGPEWSAPSFPPGTRYVWFVNDRFKLRELLSKPLDCLAVLGDGECLPFVELAVHWTVMVEVSHHFPHQALRACLSVAARVTRERFLFVDVLRGDRLRSNLTWQLDLGRFPR